MGLTVTEKEHWKERIDQAIESLYAADDAGFLTRVEKQAEQKAIDSLGIAALKEREVQIEQEKKAVEREEIDVSNKMLAAIRRCNVEDIDVSRWAIRGEIADAIRLRREVHQREILRESPVGRRILELRKEKEELLDTVWLATSGKQIKELWQTVTDLLSQEVTPLQAEALRIAPLDDAA